MLKEEALANSVNRWKAINKLLIIPPPKGNNCEYLVYLFLNIFPCRSVYLVDVL